MKYLLEFKAHTPSPFASLDANALKLAHEALENGHKDGSICGCFTKVGGGGYMIVNAKNNEALLRELRYKGITDVDVHPVVDTRDVIMGHHEHRTMGEDEHKAKHRHGDQKAFA